MYTESNVTSAATVTPAATELRSRDDVLATPAAQRERASEGRGLLFCLLAVLGFSFTLPATRIASGELDPFILGPGRGAVAALLALIVLCTQRASWPASGQLWRLCVVASCVVVGFPLLTSLALMRVPTHHAVVLVGLTPLTTSSIAALRNGERPSLAFWSCALFGACATIAFGLAAHGFRFAPADALLLAAVLVVALGYSEGARLTAELGGVRVTCWGLVLALPVTTACIVYALVWRPLPVPSAAALLSFGYLSLVSSLLAFYAWYRGLAAGGLARGSQVQLLQPILSLVWCSVLLSEPIGPATLLAGAAVVLSALASRFTRT